jgi:hypothetical protein
LSNIVARRWQLGFGGQVEHLLRMLKKDYGGQHDQGASLVVVHYRSEGGLKIFGTSYVCGNEPEIQGPSCSPDLPEFVHGGREAQIPKNAHALGVGNSCGQEFQALGGELARLHA